MDTTTPVGGRAAGLTSGPTSRLTSSAAGGLAGARRLVGGGLLATAHVALAASWAWVPSTVLVTLLVLGVALLPLFLLGAPLLVGALLVARAVGALERARYAAVLGVDLPAPPPPAPRGARGVWASVVAVLRDGAAWRALAWGALVLPVVAAVEAAVLLGLWSTAAAGLTQPLWVGAAPADGWLRATGLDLPVGPLLGLLLVPVALVAARGCAAADTALARSLLTASASEALQARVEQLTATRAAAAEAADAERRRIERDLHDGAQQRLVALAVDLGMASARMDADPDGARDLVTRAHGEAKLALAELRDLARGIHPAVLTDRGLDAALSGLAVRSPVPVAVDVDLPARCSPTAEATAYFVVAEALANVAKHARATRATVTVRRVPGDGGVPDRLSVAVRDDGVGGADPARGSGLAGLARRVAGADGVLRLSSPAGGPTELVVEVPCAS